LAAVNDPRDAALRPLHGVRDALTSLRLGGLDPEAERDALLRVCEAIEAALRRLLRDDASLPLELRLRALAADELSAEEVVSALRQNDRVSIELAATFHDLLGVRRRLRNGAFPARREVELGLQAAEHVEREVLASPAPSRASAGLGPPPEVPADSTVEYTPDDLPPPAVSRSGLGLPRWWGAVAIGALLLVALGLWWFAARSGPRYDEAIALFRTGDYARAEVQFAQHAEARPNDPTPRLYLARIYRRTARYAEAQEQLRRALEATPEDAALHRELGFLLLDVGRADAAVGRFRSAVERDSESAEGWIGLVRALRESGQPEAAERVLARAPAEVRALLQRGGNTPGN
jgi:tetratricopeptide (TPR) repeat protein